MWFMKRITPTVNILLNRAGQFLSSEGTNKIRSRKHSTKVQDTGDTGNKNREQQDGFFF